MWIHASKHTLTNCEEEPEAQSTSQKKMKVDTSPAPPSVSPPPLTPAHTLHTPTLRGKPVDDSAQQFVSWCFEPSEPRSAGHIRAINPWSTSTHKMGAGIAQWLEHRTRDWKVAGSNPCWNGGRIFFSRVDFLCWLLFRYPFHPRVTTVARKKSRSFCQKCRWQVTAKHAYTLRMWILLNRASALVTTCP